MNCNKCHVCTSAVICPGVNEVLSHLINEYYDEYLTPGEVISKPYLLSIILMGSDNEEKKLASKIVALADIVNCES